MLFQVEKLGRTWLRTGLHLFCCAQLVMPDSVGQSFSLVHTDSVFSGIGDFRLCGGVTAYC